MPRLSPTSSSPFYDLARGFLRMSWNKFNLYNLSKRGRSQNTDRLSVFSQKWVSKRDTRAYHLPEVTERQFIQRHFKTRLPLPDLTRKEKENMVPVQALAFADLERRLDVLLFRSHFTSSTRQARHMITTGKVFVNGERV